MEQTGVLGARLTYGLVEQYQKGWMYSDGHRQNLLTPEYRQFGYGIATNPVTGTVYGVLQLFVNFTIISLSELYTEGGLAIIIT